MRDPDPAAPITILEDAWRMALRADSLIVALPVAVGNFYFCLRLARLARVNPGGPTGTGS